MISAAIHESLITIQTGNLLMQRGEDCIMIQPRTNKPSAWPGKQVMSSASMICPTSQMMGDQHTLLDLKRLPDNAWWPNKYWLVALNQRNGVKNILILENSKTPIAWPESMTEEEAKEIIRQCEPQTPAIF